VRSVWHRERQLSEAAREFVETASEVGAERQAV
jgi:hypothetical protein